jgi:hypothetical protein
VLAALFLAATVGATEAAATASTASATSATSAANATNATSAASAASAASARPHYSLGAGPTFSGIYYPPYGGNDPYGEGIRLEAAMRLGTGSVRFHALLAASWTPFLTLHGGGAGPPVGEIGVFGAVGIHDDTRPGKTSAFIWDLDGMVGASEVGRSDNTPNDNTPNGTKWVDPVTSFYPMGLRLACGVRFDSTWEVLVIGDLAAGPSWEWVSLTRALPGFAVHGATAILVSAIL